MPTRRDAFYLPLEAVRGLCAVTIIYHHLKWTHVVGDFGPVAHASLLVEMFMALSAFVISARYLDRIRDTGECLRFMWLRAARVLPLHFFILGVWLASGAYAVASHGGSAVALATSADFLKRVSLLHAVFGSNLPWNVPSWTMAVEFWTYLLFGVALLVTGSKRNVLAATLGLSALGSLATLIFVMPGGIYEHTGPATLVRCIYAFSLGALGYLAYAGLRIDDRRIAIATATCIEIAAVTVLFSSLTMLGDAPVGVFVPLLFPVILGVLAWGRGLVSRILSHPWLVGLGTLSYSIYMLHSGLWMLGMKLVGVLDAEHDIVGYSATHPGQLEFFGSKAATFLVATAFVAFVILCSSATYRLIERPARDAMRRWIETDRATVRTRAPERAATGAEGLGAPARA